MVYSWAYESSYKVNDQPVRERVTTSIYINSLHTGSLNKGLRELISVHGKPINRLVGRACHAVTIYAGKVLQTYVITRSVTTNK